LSIDLLETEEDFQDNYDENEPGKYFKIISLHDLLIFDLLVYRFTRDGRFSR